MRLALCVILLVGCDGEPADSSTRQSWRVELGIPGQAIPMDALGVTDREAWLLLRPRVVVDAGGAAIASSFGPAEMPDEVRLDGLFETREEFLSIRSDQPSDASGLDHNLSWWVEINDDRSQLRRTWIGAEVLGNPGCGGDRQPSSVEIFDADRQPLEWDGEHIEHEGLTLAFVIPDHECSAPD